MPDDFAAGANKKLVLIDGNSLLYRGFFAMRALTTSAGQHTNAVYLFTMMLLTLLTEQKPDVIICAWDTRKPTFRHEAYADYKGQRLAPPAELIEQGPVAREMLAAFKVPMVEAPGFEADDIIGALARRGRDLGYEILIVTGDLDALQLVEPGVRVLTTVRGVTDTILYDTEAVLNRYGLEPHQLTDYRALKGDTSDNIPGIPGVGDKTATQLLQQFGTIENMLERTDEIKSAKLQTSVRELRDQIVLAKRLATILTDIPLEGIDIPALDADPHAPDWAAVRALFEKLEFRTMLRRIPDGSAPAKSAPEPPAAVRADANIDAPEYDPFGASEPAAPPAPAAVYDFRDADAPDGFREAIAAARAAYRVGLRFHTDDGLLDSRIRGVGLAVGNGTVYYIPIEMPAVETAAEPASPPGLGGLFGEASALPAPESPAALPAELIALLRDPKVAKATHDAKSDFGVLERYGVELAGVAFDTELAAYLLNAGRRSGYPLEAVAADYAGRDLKPLDKKERKTVDTAAAFAYDREQTLKGAEAILATMIVQEPRLAAEGLTSVLETLELPVAPILAEMELAGLAVDVAVLNRMSAEMQARIVELEREIFAIAGQEFSIASIKQLQEILFEKLKLPATKKTKTGYSTGADVLEELAPDYPIVGLIIQHRELAKLKGTYADAMPLLVRPDTGRIHTSLNQTVAATGRLSSSNPNLQNIPIRTAIGREIRRAFVAPPGLVLVSADYSQIELRLFAHVSGDAELVAAFSSGEDIHKYTASRVYGVPVGDVTSDMRRAAKTVNYAVIYGISEFALARLLGISMATAKELKSSYFARFPGVRDFIESTIQFARDHGYVQTLLGRRRQIPDIHSRVFQFRQSAERAAANMPIQGSSADIMKLAMISVRQMLRQEKFKARLLLQVHDELLFEAPPEEVSALASRVHDCMAHAYPLNVALDVEVKTGATWADVTPVEDFDAIVIE
jgi:DNA polymerase-1